ncbi:MAG TPA: hypothetical protein VH188_05750 [Chthoniobacterales bacterium]|jgi:hypothetical protein|nr:hypothetical protein [Chthoniobacterales bacterium]
MPPGFQKRFDSIGRTLRQHPLLFAFIVLALVARIIFWIYTHRVWEDALITLTAARNVWEGYGLTHHAAEPRVHSFTSPISVLIPILAEWFHAGLIALRVSSLITSVAAIFFAYRIGVLLAFHWAAQVLVLAYLACDQLQIFFGMTGMETQVVTAVALGVLYFFMRRAWWSLGVFSGLATISRPEFILFLLPPIGIALLVFHRHAILKVLTPALAIAVPWYGFATLYYGSPIPNTIVAKSESFRHGFFTTSWDYMWRFTVESWRDYVPFKEFRIADQAPLPDLVLKSIGLTLLLFFIVGLFVSAKRGSGLVVGGIAVIGFGLYRSTMVLNSYYMWYLPPFLALAFLVAAYGLSQLARRMPQLTIVLGVTLALSYALHLPFSMPLDKKVQKKIEVGVRLKAGRILNAMMAEKDTVVSESLGYIGWAAFNKTIFDYPGLGSKVSVRAVKKMAVPTLAELVDALQPTYVVVRPHELDYLQRNFPATAAKYEVAAHVQPSSAVRLANRGYVYSEMDTDFRILRRTRDFEQVVRP